MLNVTTFSEWKIKWNRSSQPYCERVIHLTSNSPRDMCFTKHVLLYEHEHEYELEHGKKIKTNDICRHQEKCLRYKHTSIEFFVDILMMTSTFYFI